MRRATLWCGSTGAPRRARRAASRRRCGTSSGAKRLLRRPEVWMGKRGVQLARYQGNRREGTRRGCISDVIRGVVIAGVRGHRHVYRLLFGVGGFAGIDRRDGKRVDLSRGSRGPELLLVLAHVSVPSLVTSPSALAEPHPQQSCPMSAGKESWTARSSLGSETNLVCLQVSAGPESCLNMTRPIRLLICFSHGAQRVRHRSQPREAKPFYIQFHWQGCIGFELTPASACDAQFAAPLVPSRHRVGSVHCM